jgi:trimethylamine monooxygenase
MYLGMQDQFYTFNMFDAQAWYARDVILDRIQLPDRATMAADSDGWVGREEQLGDPFEQIDFQTDYTRELCAATDYPAIDLDLIAAEFKEWEHDKEHSITGYRD